MALLVGLLGLEPALNFLCLDLEVGWLASGRRAEAVVGRRMVRCCRGCVAGAALWGAHVLRSGYGRDSGAENNNNNNTAITTDWTLPSFAKARFASPVVYPPVLRVRRASADCLLYYVFITFMQGVYSIHREREQGDMYHSKEQHPDSPPRHYTLPSTNKHPFAAQEAFSRFY